MSSTSIYTHELFIDNKYKTLYFKIINNAKERQIIPDYTEIHHIIPRSLGGTDDKFNLVRLTAREHFICHYLLLKFTQYSAKRSVYQAFNMMKRESKTQTRYFNSKLYAASRKEFSRLISEHMKENSHSRGKMWFTNTILDISKPFPPNQINDLLEQCWIKGRKNSVYTYKNKNKSKDTLKKMSDGQMGIPKSKEAILKQKETIRLKKLLKTTQ